MYCILNIEDLEHGSLNEGGVIVMPRFLIKQRAVLKLYLLTLIEKKKMYGRQMLLYLREELEPYGFKPTHTELYKALHELEKDKIVRREKAPLHNHEDNYQEIVYYHLREEGRGKAETFKKQVKHDLDRSIQLLEKIRRENL